MCISAILSKCELLLLLLSGGDRKTAFSWSMATYDIVRLRESSLAKIPRSARHLQFGLLLVKFVRPLSSPMIHTFFEGTRWIKWGHDRDHHPCIFHVFGDHTDLSHGLWEVMIFKNHDGQNGKGPVSEVSFWPFPIITALQARPGSGLHLSPASTCPPTWTERPGSYSGLWTSILIQTLCSTVIQRSKFSPFTSVKFITRGNCHWQQLPSTCLISGSWKRKALICGIFQFLWWKYHYHRLISSCQYAVSEHGQ